jgi:drug/metabolite transporter (DMT)-like permease
MTDTTIAGDAPSRRGFAMAIMIVSSIGISFGGLVLRSMSEADAWQINFYRALALAIAIASILIVQYRGQAFVQVRRIGRPGLASGALLTVAGITFLQAITNTTVANTLFTLSAIPFITAALAWLFLRETLQRATILTMLAAALGVGVMMVEGIGLGSLYGNGMALVTAFCFAGFAVIVRRNRQVDMLPTLMVSGLAMFVVSFILRWDDLAIPLNDILLCFLWGGILSGVGNALFIVASRHLVAAELTLFMLLEFALGPIWVWLFVSEVPTVWTIVGGVLVISSVTVRALLEMRRSAPKLKRGRPSPM